MKAIIILLLSVSMYGQVSPAANPTADARPLGQYKRTSVADAAAGSRGKVFLGLESTMVASAAFDTGTTIHNLRNGCSENNPLIGSHPSTAKVVAFEAGWTAGELVIAHFLRHRHPKIAAVLLGESIIEHGVAGGLNTTQKCF